MISDLGLRASWIYTISPNEYGMDLDQRLVAYGLGLAEAGRYVYMNFLSCWDTI